LPPSFDRVEYAHRLVLSGFAGNTFTLKIKMTQLNHYRGYAVHAFTHRLHDKTFSANVMLERPDTDSHDSTYRFFSLDYFSRENDAIEYSRRWARDWIDTRG
jgi:hypothetical protein